MQLPTSSITFRPSNDVYISQFYSEQNFCYENNLYCGPYQSLEDRYRSLIKFDFDSLGYNFIPPNSTICSAHLILKISRNELKYDMPLYVYRIYQDWNETVVNWQNQPLKSNEYYAKTLISPNNEDYLNINITDLVMGWYSGWYVNNGFLLAFEETDIALVGFYSSKNENSKMWPKLLIFYYQNGFIYNGNQTCYPGIVIE